VSFDIGKNFINNASNDAAHLPIESAELSSPRPLGSEWITLSVRDCYHYINNVPIEFHLRGRTITNNRKDFCVVFDLSDERDSVAIGSGGDSPCEAYIPLNGTGQSQVEQFVLVGVGEISQDGQERRKGWMRSIVRLRRLDSCLNWIAYRPKLPAFDGSIIEGVTTVRDGELQLARISGQVGRSLVNGNCINEMVESVPEIVESVGDDQRPSLYGRGFINPNDDAVSCAIRILLCEQTVRVSVRPCQDFILEGLSMFLAPS
jgi:hypothetical protein